MKSKNIQLLISALVVAGAALAYGVQPDILMPYLFGFEVGDRELLNIFRAIMGLYLGFAGYWLLGIRKDTHWRAATRSNVIFMGGLGLGRALSLLLDGFSPQYGIGMILEFSMMAWGIRNLRAYPD